MQQLAEVTGDTGMVLARGGMCPSQSVDGGANCGVRLWAYNDSNWGVYVAQPGAGKSLAGGTAVASLDARTVHAMRFRSNNGVNNSYIWENSSESCLMSLTSDTGDLYVKRNVNVAGDITAFYNTSDARFKADVRPMEPLLPRLACLRPVRFTWNAQCPNTEKVGASDTGLVAQELQDVFPELVEQSAQGHLVVRYEKAVPFLLKGLQELHEHNKRLQARLAALEIAAGITVR